MEQFYVRCFIVSVHYIQRQILVQLFYMYFRMTQYFYSCIYRILDFDFDVLYYFPYPSSTSILAVIVLCTSVHNYYYKYSMLEHLETSNRNDKDLDNVLQ